jgi:tetratricopeptide (TPR) repeat protein
MFADWLATTEEKPASTQLFSAAYANYMTRHFDTAEDLILRALEGKSSIPDAWHRLHYQILFDLERYDEAEQILFGMLNRNPANEGYWRLLANHHLRREDNRKALAALTVAYQIEVLTNAQDMQHILSLYSFAETPERAARMLHELLQQAALESDFDTLRKLGDLWLLSREREQAIGALQRAAVLAPDGKTDELLASLWFEDEQWRDAHGAFLAAIEKGGIEDPKRLYLLAGISAMRAGMPGEARSALMEASKSDTLHSQARAMLRELDDG